LENKIESIRIERERFDKDLAKNKMVLFLRHMVFVLPSD